MAVSYPFRSWLKYQNDAFYYNDPNVPTLLPDRNKFYGLLANSLNILSDTSTKAQVIASEIIKTSTNNYARFNASFTSASFFDAGNKRWQMPVASWTASFPEAIQYNSVILVADAISTTSLPITITPGNPATFTVAVNHNLNQDDEVVFTADATGTLPSPLSSDTIYYVNNTPNSKDFYVSPIPSDESGSQAVATSSAGSQVRMRYAKGRLVGLRIEDSPITLPASTPHSWSFYLSNAAYFGIGAGS